VKIPGEISARKAAQQLGIRLDAVYALIWAGRLPARKVNGLWQIPSSAVDERIKTQAARRNKSQLSLSQAEVR
jgi:excisionase family DNA binding protein